MTKLDRAKKIISDNYRDAECGIFDCHNFVGDNMETIYDEDGLREQKRYLGHTRIQIVKEVIWGLMI